MSYTAPIGESNREPVRPQDVSVTNSFFLTAPVVQYPLLKSWHDKLAKIITTPFWIAGGALTSLISGEAVKDWDIFTSDWKSAQAALNANAKLEWENSHVANYKHPSIKETIQLIKRDHESPLFTAQQIDLTICAGAFDGTDIVLHDSMIEDIENNRIILNTVKWPFSTLNRVMKYSYRGYTAEIGVLVTLAHLIREADVSELTHLSFYLEEKQ